MTNDGFAAQAARGPAGEDAVGVQQSGDAEASAKPNQLPSPGHRGGVRLGQGRR